MNKKDLEKLGLTTDALEKAGLKPDVLDEIIVLHGKGIETQKAAVLTMTTENEALKSQLAEAGKTIEGFKKLDVDGIKAAADDYKAKFEQAQKDAADQLAALKFDHALEGALTAAKAKNPKAVRALLKADDLKLADDGSIVGLKEQLEKVKSENDYLFDGEGNPLKIVAGGGNHSVTGDPFEAAVRKGARLEQPKKDK